MITRDRVSGTYHWTDGGQTSWYEFACAIQEEALNVGQLDKPTAIRPVTSEDYPTAATRPAFSVLDCSATTADFGVIQTPWRDNLRDMLEKIS